MHAVAILALDGVVPFDLATPLEVFDRVRLTDGSPGYEVRVCAVRPTVRSAAITLTGLQSLACLPQADTIVVPGCADVTASVHPEAIAALRTAAATGRTRVAAICGGAFTLAAAGLLDGRTATTHWVGAELLAALYPAVSVDPRPLYVDEGDILTSAGAAAGLDLCLHLVRKDYGAAVAAAAARLSVVPLQREGGQAQFILTTPRITEAAPLATTLTWLRDNSRRPLTLADIAAHASTSVRTLTRRFAAEVGCTPVHYLRTVRIRQAQELLETTGHPVERIAREVGFGSPTNFRDAFKALVGVPPANYRRAFRARTGGGRGTGTGPTETGGGPQRAGHRPR